MAINPGYFFREAGSSFVRNWVMSLGAVITIFFSLLLVGVFVITGLLIDEVISSVEEKILVVVYLKDGAANEDILALQDDILADTERVKGVTYVNKDEALERFKDMIDDPEIWENFEEGRNPLPASLEVELNDADHVHEVVAAIKANEHLPLVIAHPEDSEKDLKYGQDVIDKLFQVARVTRWGIVILVAMLSFVSMIFISNTIRLAIFARRKEIGIMRLVGASNWFIRTPFLLEGVMQGLIGAALAVGIVVGIRIWAVPWLNVNLPFVPIALSASSTTQLILLMIGAGILLGVVGSGFALRRYLRV